MNLPLGLKNPIISRATRTFFLVKPQGKFGLILLKPLVPRSKENPLTPLSTPFHPLQNSPLCLKSQFPFHTPKALKFDSKITSVLGQLPNIPLQHLHNSLLQSRQQSIFHQSFCLFLSYLHPYFLGYSSNREPLAIPHPRWFHQLNIYSP